MKTSPARQEPPVITVLKDGVKSGLRTLGLATSGMRGYPDFVIIGAKRGGTTSLYFYLRQHPQIAPLFPSRMKIKGTHFLDTRFNKGVAWYRSHFPTGLYREVYEAAAGRSLISGEASPYYLFHPFAADRAGRIIPRAKIIVLLRNPIDRAYSHYRERVLHGVEPFSFEEAVRREPERLAGQVERMRRNPNYKSFAHEHFSYVSQGMYLEPLKEWLARFPREQVLIMRSEDLFKDPLAVLARTLSFLDLPNFEPPELEPYNKLVYEPMDRATREQLKETFAEHNERLQGFLGMDLRWTR